MGALHQGARGSEQHAHIAAEEPLQRLDAFAGDLGVGGMAPEAQLELADRAIEAGVEEMLCTQVISMQNRGLVPNKESSIAKLFSSELDVRISRTAMNALGLYGQLSAGSPRAPLGGRFDAWYRIAVGSTLAGGTSEIQRGVIAQRGLGLPRG